MPNSLTEALKLFGLSEPLSPDILDAKRDELLALWHPHRYASLTNNPKQYMSMYKKGEVMTREVQAAYHLLLPLAHKYQLASPQRNTNKLS